VAGRLGAAIAIGCGGDHTAAVTRDGVVVCWGCGYDARCLVPDTLGNVVSISCGDAHTVTLTREGRVVCRGSNESGQCSVLSIWRMWLLSRPVLTTRWCIDGCYCCPLWRAATCALTTEGQIVFWGSHCCVHDNIAEDLDIMMCGVILL
jgi:alpha-tubulin suppressor-like RCC1 family protein